MRNLIFKILAAMQIGKDAYPPIPKIIEGLLINKKINDIEIEKKISIKEKIFVNIFFVTKLDEGKIKTFKFFDLFKYF